LENQGHCHDDNLGLGFLSQRMGDPVSHACGGPIQANAIGSQGVVAVDFFRALDWPVALCPDWPAYDASMARRANGQAALGHGQG
jgi:hypothetical protein